MLEELKEANEYIYKKIEKFISYKNDILNEIEEEAKRNSVPIISREISEFLRFLIQTNKNIKHILEIGTATGYSGIIMLSEIQNKNGTLTSIEIDEKRFNVAKENFKNSKLNGITQILGDATIEIKKLREKYDLIFIDAAKGQYKTFFEDSYKLLNEGGIIFIDNIMFRGYMYKDIPKRYKTITKRLDEFIDYLYENYNFVLLPISDGVGLIYKS